ncbi:MAG: hypothetical protein LBQ08_01405 [Holosporaceae bacterium]|jgi:hypothetical protein|nr:hypothetical protein [Holosporaceae bacterium]
MKKIIGITFAFVLSFGTKAMLIEQYKEHARKFSSSTDLIHGFVLLNRGVLKEHRFYGPISFFRELGRPNDGKSCSFLDTSAADPMTDLLIQLFPSAGIALNAQGTGSLAFIPKKLPDFICGMFKIADDVRSNKQNSNVFEDIKQAEGNEGKIKSFVKRYFSLSRGKFDYFRRLFRLGKNVACSVLQEVNSADEMNDSYKKEHPYPPFFTNYLISAYVWSALPESQLEELAHKLGYKSENSPYDSTLTTRIYEDIIQNPSLVPFRAGERIIANSNAHYNGKRFADCVETMLRQFFATLFSDSTDMSVGILCTDLSRIPAESPLMNFFAPSGISRDIRSLANDGTQSIRDEWAAIVSGHQTRGINYYKEDHNMYGGWGNSIKLMCLLMEGYSAGTSSDTDSPKMTEFLGKKSAEDRIKQVNRAVSDGTFSITPDDAVAILNDLLKIRTDVELVAEKVTDLVGQKGEVVGHVLIYPENHQANNSLYFYNAKMHAQLFDIPRRTQDQTPIESPEGASWIEELYNNGEIAITGNTNHDDSYHPIAEAEYPLLECLSRFGSNYRMEYLPQTIWDVLHNEAFIEGVARLIYGGERCSAVPIIKLFEGSDIPLANQILFCEFVANNAVSNEDVVESVAFLKRHAPSKAEAFNKLVSEDSSIKNLLLQRYCFDQYENVDEEIVQQLRTATEEEIETIRNEYFGPIYRLYSEHPERIKLISSKTLTLLLSYIQSETAKFRIPFEDEMLLRHFAIPPIAMLDLLDVSTIDQVFIEFEATVTQVIPRHFFPLELIYNRSDAKLEFLLSIASSITPELADKILSDYQKPLTLRMASSLIMSIPEGRIDEVLTKTTIGDTLTPQNAREIMENAPGPSSNRLGEVIDALATKFGKFSTDVARELIVSSQEPSLVIPHMERGEELPSEVPSIIATSCGNQKFINLKRVYESNCTISAAVSVELLKCMDLGYFNAITSEKLEVISRKYLNAMFAAIKLDDTFYISRPILKALFDKEMAAVGNLSVESAGLLLKKAYITDFSFHKEIIDTLSPEKELSEEIIDGLLQQTQRQDEARPAETLARAIHFGDYTLSKVAAIKLLSQIETIIHYVNGPPALTIIFNHINFGEKILPEDLADLLKVRNEKFEILPHIIGTIDKNIRGSRCSADAISYLFENKIVHGDIIADYFSVNDFSRENLEKLLSSVDENAKQHMLRNIIIYHKHLPLNVSAWMLSQNFGEGYSWEMMEMMELLFTKTFSDDLITKDELEKFLEFADESKTKTIINKVVQRQKTLDPDLAVFLLQRLEQYSRFSLMLLSDICKKICQVNPTSNDNFMKVFLQLGEDRKYNFISSALCFDDMTFSPQEACILFPHSEGDKRIIERTRFGETLSLDVVKMMLSSVNKIFWHPMILGFISKFNGRFPNDVGNFLLENDDQIKMIEIP